ncbi:hypothetical protein T01_9860 [Trichinella spiralis]|uniref:Uncharacterized protein n=1 Tax=Trichinella spiralis TaxID=6334 RepID=A0A0V0XR14_TRISP|nr:hypothetical protein T01_9860 [Trichinella spiralis]
MSDVRDENKAPKTNEDDRAAKGNMQAPLQTLTNLYNKQQRKSNKMH